MSEFPYSAYYNFFARWFGNGAFITFAFMLWLAITVHMLFIVRNRKCWFRVPLVSAVSVVHYLIFGLLVAGGRFGGEAEFLYDPVLLKNNMYIHGGLQGILLWPLSLLPTGGFLVVLPVIVGGLVYIFIRRGKNEQHQARKTGMKKPGALVGIILIGITILISGCNRSDTELQSYEYTSTNEIKYVEYYETSRIKDAVRKPVITLEQLAYADLELMGGEEVESYAIEYTLPDDATQGPDKWYISNFHFLIELEEDTGGGFCNVAASQIGSVQFETLNVNGAPFIRVGGQSVTSTRVEVRYYNYMTLSSVKPGNSEMTFKYKEYQGTKIKRVTIFNDTGISVTTMAPSEYEEGQKVTVEDQEKAKEIAFNDARVQEIVEGKEYAIRITKSSDMIRLASEPPDDDIEIRLFFRGTYLIAGIEASELDIFVDLNEEAVTYLFPLDAAGMPVLTASEKDRVVKIALGDATVKGLLEGKGYEITRIGICQGGPVGRLGANMDIVFDQAYQFTGEFPYFPDERKYLDQPIEGIEVFVNLKDEAAVQIWPDIVTIP